MLLQEQVSLKNYNTFGIHAQARYYVRIDTLQPLLNLLAHPSFQALPRLVLNNSMPICGKTTNITLDFALFELNRIVCK